ncbi:MAG: hypothetical protein ACK4MF_02420 [Hyphomicrobiaceae bacterium]
MSKGNMFPALALPRAVMAPLTALAIMSTAPVTLQAADLGGECCADLDERIAELEATVARKGTRKISLQLSGQVSQALLAFDDGGERNVYQVSNWNSSDRLRMDGSAVIAPGWRSGYMIELGLGLPSTNNVSQNNDDGGNGAPLVRQSLWYIDSKRLGAITVGLAEPATDGIIGYNLGGTSIAASANTTLVGTNLFTRNGLTGTLNSLQSGNTTALTWRRFLPQLDTSRGNLVRYDSPVLMGFSASASWGEDDFWDAALRFARLANGFRFAFGAGYYENREEFTAFGTGNSVTREIKGSASVLHEPSGLFLSGAYVHREHAGTNLAMRTFACYPSNDAAQIRALGIACANRPDFDYYWLSGGIRLKAIPLGTTTIYGEFARGEDGVTGLNVATASATGGDIDQVTSSSMTIWGAGIVQRLSDADMEIFASYRNFSADVTGLETNGAIVAAPIEDAHLFMAGSRIRF